MDSTSRETLMMKTFEEQSGGAEFLETDALPAVIADCIPSLQQKSLPNIFRQDLQGIPSLEPHSLLPSSPSKTIPQELPSPSSDLRLHTLNVESSLRIKGCDSLKTSSILEGTEFGIGNSILSYLNPPQIGGTKFKRGPGRPRKECVGLKSPRHPSTQKIKSLLGGVRGRKKSDLSTALMNYNTSQSTGDASIGESPPRGTDDTAESDSSSVASSLEKLQDDFSMFPELWPGKVCSFCNLGERSMLGQGDLLRLEIPPGFDPVAVSKTLSPKNKIERDNAVDKCQKLGLFSRRQKGSGKMKRLVSQSSLESLNEPVDEVCGHSEEPEYSSVFDAGYGFHFVHHNCALWCDGVEKKLDGSFSNLEVEILRALSQRCQHCGNFGAGLMCKAEGCNLLLHFPCAAVSGAFQDTSNQTTVCSSHVNALYASGIISGICTVCDSRSDITSLIMCSSCGRHYHGPCMALNSDHGSVNLNIRAGWQCPACKICQACRQPGEEGKLLACDTCDKTYHIFCLRPALSSIPKHSWKCKMCRVCTDCGARTPGSGPSSRWHANFSVCDSCYQQRNKGLACPLCGRAYRHVAQKVMLQCNLCKKYVHGACDPAADLATYQQRKELYPEYEYICMPCKASGTGLNTSGGNPKVLQTLKRSDESEDGVHLNFSAVSQDSLLSFEDESFPGTDNSNDLVWPDKSLMSTSIEDSKLQLPQQIHFISKEKHFMGFDKLQKKKFIPGKLKVGEKLGQTALSIPIGRKNKCNEFAKKRGPKPKLRLFGSGRGSMSRNSLDVFSKDEEPGVENRMVLCSARDDYVLQQDVCVMCGAFGSDLEGRLISCSQCGQCYHPYCVNVKVTKVILLKGWRCLDCTVCEGCGQRNDESRLILCDECDVSFHIYCIDPPLEQVPHGTWKCKWCAVCHYCGSNDSRLSGWFENYTKCGICASQTQCPVCSVDYSENDLIIKCLKCDRWLHGACDMIKSIKDAEKCADGHYVCILCRPMDTLPLHLRLPPKLALPKRELPPIASDGFMKSNNHILVDGIYLSEYGVHQIKSLTLDLPRKKRKKMPNITDMEAGILAAIESVVSGGDDKPSMSNKLENSDKDKDSKKRQRNLQKLGIGGFLVRLRGPRFKEEEVDPLEMGGSVIDGEKPKRKPQKRKSKNKLTETFPTYLQEAFFGKAIMNSTKDVDMSTLRETELEGATIKAENTIQLSKEELQEIESIKSRKNVEVSSLSGQKSEKEDPNKILTTPTVSGGGGVEGISDMLTMPSDLLNSDLVNTIMNDRNIKTESDSLSENHRPGLGQAATLHNIEDHNHKDDLSDFLSAQFNIESMESGLPSMDSKDVEDIFKGVLVEESQEALFHVSPGVQAQQLPRPRPPVPNAAPATAPTIISSPVGPPSQGSPSVVRPTGIQQNLASPVSFPPPSPYHSEYSNSPQFSPAFSEPPSPWPAPVEDVDQPSSYNQRSILKWEADEGLGHSATISAVLYANINHPELKRDYASWTERSKQIAKIWRGLPAEKRAPYLQKARENRAACRMQKAQQIPKDLGGSSCKKELSSPENSQASPMRSISPQTPNKVYGEMKNTCTSDNKANTFPTQFPSTGYNVSSAPNAPSPFGNVAGAKPDRRLLNIPGKLAAPPDSCRNKHFNDKNSYGDQHIKVLTPSEIMKSLPDLSQDECGFSSRMDQDKIVTVNQKSRVETQEERHWKQMQALRQQQSQLQESQAKEVCMSPTTHPQVPFSPGPNTGILRPPRPVGSELGTETIRQPLHISTPHQEQKMSQLQSPLQQQQLPGPTAQTVSSEMAPPGQVSSPMFSPPGQMMRSPVYARPSFISSKPQLPPSNENYGNIHGSEDPSRPNCFPDSGAMSSPGTSQYNQKSIESSDNSSGNNSGPPASQGNETRQHLRDLLQRQQVKKLEQDQMSPNSIDPQQNTQRMWSHEEWQKSGGDGGQIRHPMNSRGPIMHVNQFRQPYLPGHPRMSPGLAQNIQTMHRPSDFRMNVAQSPQNPNQTPDIRTRIMLSHQRSIGNNNRPQPFQATSGNIFQPRNPIDSSYGQLVVQQQRMQGGGIVSSPSMLAQQLGRPLQSVGHGQPSADATTSQTSMQQSQPPVSLQQQMNASSLSESSLNSHLPSDHQELPDSVTAELEKLEQEQHNDHNQDAETSELADLGMDDDELLGMGADFNILEYADPELDEVVGGEKTNILDNLDLEEEDKDDKDKRKEPERGVKKENVEFQVPGKPAKPIKTSDSMDSSSGSGMMSPSNPNYGGHPSGSLDNVPQLRPAQPPPPYPGPPPPYPGRPQQIGIINGCGLNSTTQPVTAPAMGMNNHNSGFLGRPPFPPHISPTMLSNSNHHHLSLQQRKTLLLQEQPLLLEDLLEQEKREQMRQSSGGLIGAAPEEPLLSDFDFERLKADVLSSSSLPVSLSPPNVVGMMRNQPAPVPEWQMDNQMTLRAPEPQMETHLAPHQPPVVPSSSALVNISRLPLYLPAPPNPPEHPTTEQERQMQIQYEQWLYGQQQVLGLHLKCFETEVTKLRKTKKSLNSKLRQLRKNNNELNETDAAELERIGKELPGLQKQLDQARKQSRQHNLLIQDYRNKQQKRQQMMGMSPGGQAGPSTQASPLGAASSPLHSTPQSPLMSPSPMQPSPLMQHSPMASPLTPSPGPAANLSQTSPRGPMNPGMHMMDDAQFSPNPDGSNRIICNQPPGAGRLHQMSHMRMASAGSPGHPIMIAQAGGMNSSNPPGVVMSRGMNPNMVQQMQHRPHNMENQMHRMRPSMPQDHMRAVNPMVNPRFQRMGMNPEMMMRARPPTNFGNQPQMGMSPTGHYVSRVPFPSQSPTGSVSLRSPSPMTPLGNLGSPPNPMMMSQNRVSPASSPMRRPSGSGSIGSASPMAERPQSVENPLTPRNSGSSRPHTPSNSLSCQPMDQHPHMNPHQQHMNPVDNPHYGSVDHCGMGNMGSPTSHKMHNFMPNPGEYQGQINNDYNSNMNSGGGVGGGGGGGSGNSHVIPFPTFSFFDGPVKLGLKGGNPFSVVTESTPTNSNAIDQPTGVTNNDSGISQLTTIPVNASHPSEDTNHAITPSASMESTNIQVQNDTKAVPSAVSSLAHHSNHSETVNCTTVVSKLEDLKTLVAATSNDISFVSETLPTSITAMHVDSSNDVQDESVSDTRCILHVNAEAEDVVAVKSNSQNHIFPTEQSATLNKERFVVHIPKPSHLGNQKSITSPEIKDINIQNLTANNSCSATTTTVIPETTTETTKTIDSCVKDKSSSESSVLDGQVSVNNSSETSLAVPTSLNISEINNISNTTVKQEHDNSMHNNEDKEQQDIVANFDTEKESIDSTNSTTIDSDAIVQPSDEIIPTVSSESTQEMSNYRTILGQPQGTNQSGSGGSSPLLSVGESQNALLKQLLQNTGCASTAQVSENVGFSLTSLTKPANPTVHTSHLSEAATRLPQPAPTSRPPKPESTPPIKVITVKTEVLDETITQPTPLPPAPAAVQLPTPVPISVPVEISNVISGPTTPVTQSSVIHADVVAKTEFEDLENQTVTTKVLESKKMEDEVKKAKRRQYQSKRKTTTTGKEAPVTKKRPRKAGKPEEDFDGFIENFMVQLRQLPPVGIVEPDLGHNYNICPVFGTGDFSKLNVKGYDTRLGELSGTFGNCVLKSSSDYYSTKPFGKTSPLPIEKPTPTHRGFYNQEFAAPRTSHLGNKPQAQSRTPTPLRESDTPDTIVSSSSPECGIRESPDLFPCLKLVETEEDKKQHLRDSPNIQIAYPIPVRPLLATKLAERASDGNKENNIVRNNGPKSRSYGYLRENGNITVTLTLSSAAMDEVRVLLRNLANILSIETPTYQMEKLYPPPDQKMFIFKTKDSSDTIDLQCILNGSAKFCKHCDVLVVNNVIKKNSAELGLNGSSFDSSEELCFCSANCFFLFSVNHGVAVRSEEPSVTQKLLKEVKAEIKNRKLLSEDPELVKNLLKRKDNNMVLPTDLNKSAGLTRETSIDIKPDENVSPEKKSWKNIRYKLYPPTTSLPNKYKKPTEKELTEMMFRLGITVMPTKGSEDTRKCALCHQIGDGLSDGPGRLINFDVDKWIHLNCALWSEEVYETENGALVNVEVALKQSLNITCTICKQDGASVKCFKVRCTSVYHVGCAVKDGCAFYKNKSVYCPAHIPKGEKENELTSLSVFRRVYVQRDENRQVAVVMHHGDQHHLLRVGSLIFLNVGQLLPHQLQTFHTRHYIYPVGYKIVRFYWSMTTANRRCQYICSIHEADGKPEFRITAQEEGGKEHVVKSNTAQGAWLQVLEAVSKVRNAQDCIKVFPKYITGEDLFGLTEPAIVKVLESLPGIESLTDYNFKYGRNPLLELPLAINPSGCARSEPKLRTHFKRSHTQRTGAFRASLPSSVLSSEAACPYSKQFVHSKSSQYKKMKQEWRNNVYLARSKIQGLGLYAARDIERHTMVIEYIGETIRNELAELREKRYESQNRGIYMFRIDDERVIDATLCGGLARYINHSCNPNCVAETVEVERDLRIIIFANRRISRGEELAYDYKFEVEDDEHKIPCMCGAPNCQQWMN